MIGAKTAAAGMTWGRGANPAAAGNVAAGQSGQNRGTPHEIRSPEGNFRGNSAESPHFFAPEQFIDRSVDEL